MVEIRVPSYTIATNGRLITKKRISRVIEMSDPSNEDTSQIDRELIAHDLERIAKLARNLHQPDTADEISALATKLRKPPE